MTNRAGKFAGSKLAAIGGAVLSVIALTAFIGGHQQLADNPDQISQSTVLRRVIVLPAPTAPAGAELDEPAAGDEPVAQAAPASEPRVVVVPQPVTRTRGS